MVVEAGLDDSLAVVESAAESDIVDVGVGDRNHLQLLRARGAALGVHDEALNARLSAQPVNRRAARVTRSCAHDGDFHAGAVRQKLLVQVAKELERHILEGKGGSVVELEHVHAVRDLTHRRHAAVLRLRVLRRLERRVTEGGIRPLNDILQPGFRDVIGANVEAHDLEGQILIGQSLPARLPVRRERRDGLWHEEATVRAKALQHCLIKLEASLAATSAAVLGSGRRGERTSAQHRKSGARRGLRESSDGAKHFTASQIGKMQSSKAFDLGPFWDNEFGCSVKERTPGTPSDNAHEDTIN